MDINQLLELVSFHNFLPVAFKVLSIFFAVFYLLYAVVIYRQSEIMNRTFTIKNKFIIIMVAILQIAAGVLLTLWSIFFI